MTAYPMGKIEKREARKERRAAKRAETEAIEAAKGPGKPKAGRKSKKRVPARKAAFRELVAACKEHVFERNKARNYGRCEIALACGGAQDADTWYHAWPQKGGNGLKYDPRSHFASCSKCNMGEFGARYRGDSRYVNRHRALIGEPLYSELAAMHGRRQILTAEAREMAAEIRRKTANREWS